LRYYDEVGLLKPVCVDHFNGYRYYSVDQLPRLNRILALKDLGFSLGQIAQLLDENVSSAQIQGMLRLKQLEIHQRLDEEQLRLLRVESRLRQIEKEDHMSGYDIVIKKIEPQTVASFRQVLQNPQDVGLMFQQLIEFMDRHGVHPSGPHGVVWHDAEYHENQIDTEAFVAIADALPEGDGVRTTQLPGAAAMACTIHQGSYEGFPEAYTALMSWVENNGYRIAGPIREFYLRGPGPTPTDPATYVTEIQLPVEKV